MKKELLWIKYYLKTLDVEVRMNEWGSNQLHQVHEEYLEWGGSKDDELSDMIDQAIKNKEENRSINLAMRKVFEESISTDEKVDSTEEIYYRILKEIWGNE